jgi:hypothetical protein
MLLAKSTKEFKVPKAILQPGSSARLDTHAPLTSRTKQGDRKAKRELVLRLTQILDANKEDLLTPWLAGRMYEIAKDEQVAKPKSKVLETKL